MRQFANEAHVAESYDAVERVEARTAKKPLHATGFRLTIQRQPKTQQPHLPEIEKQRAVRSWLSQFPGNDNGMGGLDGQRSHGNGAFTEQVEGGFGLGRAQGLPNDAEIL